MAAHYVGHQRLPSAANARVALAARRGPARRSSRGAPAVDALASAPRQPAALATWSARPARGAARGDRAARAGGDDRVGSAARRVARGMAARAVAPCQRNLPLGRSQARYEPTSPRYANCSEPTEAPAKRVATLPCIGGHEQKSDRRGGWRDGHLAPVDLRLRGGVAERRSRAGPRSSGWRRRSCLGSGSCRCRQRGAVDLPGRHQLELDGLGSRCCGPRRGAPRHAGAGPRRCRARPPPYAGALDPLGAGNSVRP